MKVLEMPLPENIVVTLDDDGGGTITSELHMPEELQSDYSDYEIAIDVVESLILAHACAGIDILNPQYVQGVEVALEKISDEYL